MAIIMMVIHHFFAFPDRWLESNLFITGGYIGGKPVEQMLGEMCKLCVCIFAFISGYGTYISLKKRVTFEKRILYGIKKMVQLLSMYWIAIVCFFVPVVFCFRSISLIEIVNNLLLKSTSLVHTGWYVSFYIKAMTCILLYSLLEKETSWIWDCIICFGLPMLLEVCSTGNMFSHYFPTFMLGYIFSKYSLYQVYEKMIRNQALKYMISIGLVLGLLLVRLKYGDMIGLISMITFIAPVICYVLDFILKYVIRFKYIEKILSVLAKYCTWYWFLHAIFHARILIIQEIGYLPRIPVLIIIWVFLLLTPMAMILQDIYNNYIRMIKIVWDKMH